MLVLFFFLAKSSTGLTPGLSAVTVSQTSNGAVHKNNLPVAETDSNNNCSKAVKRTPKNALDTIRAFLAASQQRVVVLKKNLVDYTVSDGSNGSSEEDPEVLPWGQAAGKRKLEEKKTEKEEIKRKRKCVQDETVKVEGKEGSEKEVVGVRDLMGVSTTGAFIGPIDTRSVTAKKNMQTVLNVQRLSENFENKHYGRKAEENLRKYNQLNQSDCSIDRSSKLQFSPVVSTMEASPKLRSAIYSVVNKSSCESSRIAPKSSDEKQTFKSYVSVVKSGKNLLSASSETTKSSWSLTETQMSTRVSVLPRHPMSEQSEAGTSKGRDTSDRVVPTPKQPFWASHINTTSSLLMGQQDNKTNEEVTSNLKKHFRTQSAPVNSSFTINQQKASGSIDLDITTSSTAGATALSQRLHFYQKSRLGSSFSSPQSSVLSSYSWRENFRRNSGSYGVPYLDSHCHLDFLFSRSRFSGSWSKFKAVNQDTFPDNFAGCVAVFCNPLSFRSEGEQT